MLRAPIQNWGLCLFRLSSWSRAQAFKSSETEVLAYPSETKYFRTIHGRAGMRDAETLLSETRIGRLTYDRAAALELGRDFSAVDEEIFNRVLREQLSGEVKQADVLPAAMIAYAASLGTEPRRYWVEKTPLHERDLETALELWPDTRAIYIVRDPRDVIASLKAQRWAPSEIEQLIPWYRGVMDRWFQLQSTLPADSVSEVRLEDLTSSPGSTLSRLCGRLELEFEDAMTKLDLSRSNRGRWRIDLTPAEAADLTRALEPFLARYGYDRDPCSAPPPEARDKLG